jgi:hypothetical protein
VTQQIRHFLDRPALRDQLGREAVTQEMSAASLNGDAGTLESREDNLGYRAAVTKGAHWRHV